MGLINTSAHGINHGGINRHNSFTILEPASGIPSDESFYSFSKTPRLASLTSRHSFEKVPSHGGSTNMASTLAAFTGGISNTYPSATITSAVQSIRSELPSLAPLPSIPSLNSTTCGNINNALNSQFLSTVKFHAPPSMQPSLANVKRCDCYGMPKICTKVNVDHKLRCSQKMYIFFRFPVKKNLHSIGFLFCHLSPLSVGLADRRRQLEQELQGFVLQKFY